MRRGWWLCLWRPASGQAAAPAPTLLQDPLNLLTLPVTAHAFYSLTYYQDKSVFRFFFLLLVVVFCCCCSPAGKGKARGSRRLPAGPTANPDRPRRAGGGKDGKRGAGRARKPGAAQERHTGRGRGRAAVSVASKRAWGGKEGGFCLRISNSEPVLIFPTAESCRSPKVVWRG